MKRNYKDQIYMFDGDKDSVYLSNVVTDPDIQVGEHTYYNDFIRDPRDFQKNNVLYHHPEVYHDKIVIGKYCSIACGATFVCAGGFHSSRAISSSRFSSSPHQAGSTFLSRSLTGLPPLPQSGRCRAGPRRRR